MRKPPSLDQGTSRSTQSTPERPPTPKKAKHPTHARHAAQEVRVIGGAFKRSKLAVVDAPGLRPTPNRVRETLFNWLGASLDGWHCADLFAGTGALGIEAASRGAAKVVLVERQAKAVLSLKAALLRLKAQGCEVLQMDAMSAANTLPRQSFDVVFIDPPFDTAVHAHAAKVAMPLLKDTGLLYIEAPDDATLKAVAEVGYALHKQSKAGSVWFALFTQNNTNKHTNEDE
jgi:16S rRNA (guanine966-N2)-methyltransferase